MLISHSRTDTHAQTIPTYPIMSTTTLYASSMTKQLSSQDPPSTLMHMTSIVLNRFPSNLSKQKINIGVNAHFPQDSFGFVTSRRSMATNHGIMVPTVTIDRDYTGQISFVLHNQNRITFSIKEGMRIAQLLILQVSTPTLHVT